jgi:hypothetical protein
MQASFRRTAASLAHRRGCRVNPGRSAAPSGRGCVRASRVGVSVGFGGDPVAVELEQIVRGRDQPPFRCPPTAFSETPAPRLRSPVSASTTRWPTCLSNGSRSDSPSDSNALRATPLNAITKRDPGSMLTSVSWRQQVARARCRQLGLEPFPAEGPSRQRETSRARHDRRRWSYLMTS